MAGLNAGNPAPTVFVGNLAYDLTDQDVIDYFSQAGPVKTVRIVTERESGKPRGFGFVEFYDAATAESAIRNLSGTELNGRTMRIVFAEGGPGDFRPRREEERERPEERSRRAAARNKLIGGDLAYHSSLGMGTLLGQSSQPGGPADQLTLLLARKTRSELYEYLAQMQGLLQQNPSQARQILVDNPQLARALFMMEIILGMVNNPLGDVAPKGVAPPGILPPKHHDAHGPPPAGGPGPMAVDAPMQQQPPHQQQYGQPPPQNGMPGGYAAQPPPMAPPPQYGMPPPQPYMPPAEPVPMASMAAPLAPLPAAAPMDPRLAATMPSDPRRGAVMPQPGPGPSGPRPMVSMAAGLQQPPVHQPAPAMQPPGLAPGAVPGMSPEQQQALLQQVMGLTPEQVELLPPQQKAQVLALQQQLRGQGR